jgi:hypothetical protein
MMFIWTPKSVIPLIFEDPDKVRVAATDSPG